MKITYLRVGDDATAVTNIVLFQGDLHVFKTDGVYRVYANPKYIGGEPGNIPRIITLMKFPAPEAHAGQSVVMAGDCLFFNYRNQMIKLEPEE
jgi:hypothetical protein